MLSDTDPKVMEIWLNLLRQKTVSEKIQMAFEMTDLVNRVSEAGIRSQFPKADEREVFLRAASLRIPRDLMVRAYGWDPAEHAAR